MALPAGATLVVEQAGRTRWSSSTTNVRALQGPGGVGRRAAAWSHASELRLRIDFAAAWSGDLHLYALDWDDRGRRQTVTVDDGSGPRVAVHDSAFTGGLWTHAPVTVPAGGSVRITSAARPARAPSSQASSWVEGRDASHPVRGQRRSASHLFVQHSGHRDV